MSAADIQPALVLGPLAAAAIAAAAPARARAAIAWVAVALLAVGSVAVAIAVARGGLVEIELAGWDAPLGIALRADGASAVLLCLTAVVAIAVTAAASDKRMRGGDAFWPLWLALLAALAGVFVAGDLFNAYVTLELLTLAAVGLVALGGRDAAAPALRYLFVAVTGSLLFLLAVALVYAETGALDLEAAAATIGDGQLLAAVLVLGLLGLGAKLALFPMHAWLPVAHPAAPSAVSAALSALVVKAALFLLWRLWFTLAPGQPSAELVATAAGALGVAGMVWGSVLALRSRRLKQIIAYSTVAQVGTLLLILPLATLPGGAGVGPEGWTGGVVLAVAHGLGKAAMFLAAGSLAIAYGSDRLGGLRGAVTAMPLTVATLGIAGVTLAGLPPTLGFVGKWQLLQAALELGQWWWVAALLVGGLLTFGYTALMVRATFNRPGGDEAIAPSARPPRAAVVAAFALAVASVVLGLVPTGIVELIDLGGDGV